MIYRLICVATIGLLLLAAGPDEKPAPESARQVDASQWLKDIQATLDAMDVLEARVRYDTIQGLVGDVQTRFGKLIYQADTPRRFRIDFDHIKQSGKSLKPMKETLVFDGRFLAEIKPEQKRFNRYELVSEAEAEAMFDLTDSRFPLPVDLNREQIEANYEVVLIDPVMPNPMIATEKMEGAVQLRLTPKPGKDLTYAQMDIWFDKATKMPRLVHAINAGDSGDESVIRLDSVKTDMKVDQGLFNTEAPKEPGWEVQFTPLGEAGREEVRVEGEIKIVDE